MAMTPSAVHTTAGMSSFFIIDLLVRCPAPSETMPFQWFKTQLREPAVSRRGRSSFLRNGRCKCRNANVTELKESSDAKRPTRRRSAERTLGRKPAHKERSRDQPAGK